MKNTTSRNLLFGFGLSIVLLVISSLASYFSIRNLLESGRMVRHSNEVVENLKRVMSIMIDAETGQRGYLLTSRVEFLRPYSGAYTQAMDLTRRIDSLTSDNPRQGSILTEIQSTITQCSEVQSRLVKEKQMGEMITIEELITGKGLVDNLRKLVHRAESEEKNVLKARTSELHRYSEITPLIIIVAAILAIGISLFYYLRVTADMNEKVRLQQSLEKKDREIANRITAIQGVAQQISEGDYRIRLDDHGSDNLGELSVSLNKMASTLETSFNQLKENSWLQEGVVRLNDLMFGDKRLETLTHDVLEFLKNYTKSDTAAFYITENETLNLQTSIALSNPVDTIKPGEGLIGEAAQYGKLMWLKVPDENHTLVSFASGQIKPGQVIIVPINYEQHVKGVIELSSIGKYSEIVERFLNETASSIAIAITSAQNRKRVQELLEETQAQTEELQVRHNEMENLNAELEVQMQRLQSSEEELRVQQEELQQANSELEERNMLIFERNKEIQERAAELEQSTRYKSEFMANMSHELRTPLNSILLLSHYLSENPDKNLTEDQVESANVIQNSGNGLLNLIDELLDLSKIEAGKMVLDYETVNIDEVVKAMKALFAPVAKEKKLNFVIKNSIVDISTIETDRMRLEQILKNLISNALKFTTEGEVTLEIKNTAKSGHIEMSVTDTGIGIEPDKLDMVFDAFQQADGSTKRKFGGTGLGLSISRQLARLLGGDISLQSEPSKGSVFTLLIPVSRLGASFTQEFSVAKEALPEVTVERKKTATNDVHQADLEDDRATLTAGERSVLIVEDDIPFAKSLMKFTRDRGYKCLTASRGDQGLELAKKHRPTAILLDIQLPVMDGWDVMDELKKDPETKHIPVHIMSSLHVKRESRIKGAVDFIDKPVAIEQMSLIFERLEDALHKSPKQVLIVEENAKHAKALAYFLETFNLSVNVSDNVDESIQTLKNREVDCVIMSMNVTERNAYNKLKIIKEHKDLVNLPVIISTGKSLSAAEEISIMQYADTIVVKTAHSYQRVLDEVSLFLHIVEEKKDTVKAARKSFTGNLHEILENKTVLIADDDVRNIFSLTKLLEKHKMYVVSAVDGKEALDKLEQNPQVDIVLMDMMMPEMDGYESTTKIRQDQRYKNLPVIAVTAKSMVGDREKCITAGASDYISKPVDIDQLVSLLRVWLYDKKG